MAKVAIGKIKIPYPMKMGMAYRVVKLPKNVVENHSTDFTLSYEMYSGSSQKKASASKSFPLTDLFSGYNPGYAYDYGMTVELTKVEFDFGGNVMFYFMLGGLTEADGATPKVFTVPAAIGTDTPVLLDYHVDFHDAYVFPEALKTAGKIEYAETAGSAGTADLADSALSVKPVDRLSLSPNGDYFRTHGLYCVKLQAQDGGTARRFQARYLVFIEAGNGGHAYSSVTYCKMSDETVLPTVLEIKDYKIDSVRMVGTTGGIGNTADLIEVSEVSCIHFS